MFVSLLLRLCTCVVRSTRQYGCEVCGAANVSNQHSTERTLTNRHLIILREIPENQISKLAALLANLRAESCLEALSEGQLLGAAIFLNSLAGLPPDNGERVFLHEA